jgi:hypothetical protein
MRGDDMNIQEENQSGTRSPSTPEWQRWLMVSLFALAMAWVESAVVYYLRTHIDRIVPYQPDPLPIIGGLGPVELVRELATLIMLFTVGWLAATTWRARIGYMAMAFGVWDIFYYVFLKLMCGWPKSLTDWDILFLIPLPWWGPVWAPVSIAALMILWGTLASQFERSGPYDCRTWECGFSLTAWRSRSTFMADALRVSGGGVDALRQLLPATFNWPLFSIALALMSAPVIRLALELWTTPMAQVAADPATRRRRPIDL